jgi:hypothetical protein
LRQYAGTEGNGEGDKSQFEKPHGHLRKATRVQLRER